MLIKQIIEFKLRGLEPSGRACTPTIGYFQDIRQIFMWIMFTAKILKRQCTLLISTWTKSLTNLTPRIQDFKRVLDKISK